MPLFCKSPYGPIVPLVVNAEDPKDLPAHDARVLKPLYACDEEKLVRAISGMMTRGKVGVAMLLRAIEAAEGNTDIDPFVDDHDNDSSPDISEVPGHLWQGRTTVTCLHKLSAQNQSSFDLLSVQGDPDRTSGAFLIATVNGVPCKITLEVHDIVGAFSTATLTIFDRQDPYAVDNIDHRSVTTYLFYSGTGSMPGAVFVKEHTRPAGPFDATVPTLRAMWNGDGTIDVMTINTEMHEMSGPTKRLNYFKIEMDKQPKRWAEHFRPAFEAWLASARHELFKPDATGYKRARAEFEALR